MDLLVVSFLAGVLTAAAPCVLPLLPVIVGGSVLSGDEDEDRRSLRHPLTIVISLAVPPQVPEHLRLKVTPPARL